MLSLRQTAYLESHIFRKGGVISHTSTLSSRIRWFVSIIYSRELKQIHRAPWGGGFQEQPPSSSSSCPFEQEMSKAQKLASLAPPFFHTRSWHLKRLWKLKGDWWEKIKISARTGKTVRKHACTTFWKTLITCKHHWGHFALSPQVAIAVSVCSCVASVYKCSQSRQTNVKRGAKRWNLAVYMKSYVTQFLMTPFAWRIKF